MSDTAIDVTVTPVEFENDSTWVNVSVRGVSSPGKDDWIGLFALDNGSTKVDPKLHAPVKFKVLACILIVAHAKN